MNGPEYSASCPTGALNAGTIGKANRQAAGHLLFLLLSTSSEQIFQISLSVYNTNTMGHLSFTYAITFTFTCSTGKVGHFNLSSSFVRFKCSFHFFLNEYDFGMNQSNISQYLFFYWNFHFLRLNLSKWLCSSLFIQP